MSRGRWWLRDQHTNVIFFPVDLWQHTEWVYRDASRDNSILSMQYIQLPQGGKHQSEDLLRPLQYSRMSDAQWFSGM